VQTQVLTLPKLAARIGCPSWQIRRLLERGAIPEPSRAGLVRLFGEGDVAAVRAALVDAGYLPAGRQAAEALAAAE
jgi:hypothetical protein